MIMILFLLLMLRVGRCSDDQIFETKTVAIGDDVKLTCARENVGSLFWIRLVSGNFPEVLGKTFSPKNVVPHITTKKEPGIFALYISKAKLSDTTVYYCIKVQQLHQPNFIFLKGIDLRVKGPEANVTAAPPSDPICRGDSVTLQCSVLSDNRTHPEDHHVYRLTAGSYGSDPSFNYTQGNSVEEHEENLEELSTKKCIYSFFTNVSSSDAGIYYCAVATCEEKVYENRSKSDKDKMPDSQRDSTVLYLLCAALAISLVVIAALVYSIKKLKKHSCGCCDAALQTNAASTGGEHQRQQMDEESLVYSAPTFISRKPTKGATRDTKTEEEESIYTDVRTVGLD